MSNKEQIYAVLAKSKSLSINTGFLPGEIHGLLIFVKAENDLRLDEICNLNLGNLGWADADYSRFGLLSDTMNDKSKSDGEIAGALQDANSTGFGLVIYRNNSQ